MAEKIDELQLGIGSDVTKVLSDLNKLSIALSSAAQKADRLGTSLSSIRGFSDAVKDLSNVNTDNLKKVNSRLRSLSKIDFSNLKDKNINIGMNVNGSGSVMKSISNVDSEMRKISSGGGKMSFGNSAVWSGLTAGLNGAKSAMSGIFRLSLKLGGQGASALGSFMSKLGLIPSHTANVNKMALTFGNLLRAVLPFYGIRGVFDWLKESVGLGSSIVEIENVINTAFGSLEKGYEDVSGYIYKWSKTTLDGFGVSELAAMQYAGRLQSIFNSSGFDVTEGMRDSAAKMSTDLIERAGDIASFYDISVDEAMTKMQAGLVGLSRPLRSLGVNLSVANLQQYALNQGITTSWKSMDQATQMALRYSYILDATKYAANDFRDTQMSMANQLRVLQLQFQMLSTTIGQGLVSAIAPVISWLNALIKRLIVAANAFKTFMWTLFGKPLGAAKGVADDLLGSLDDSVDATSDLGGGASGASDGLGSAADSAKELKKQLVTLPFDELNQLGKNTDSSSSGGSGGSGGGGGGGGIGGIGDFGLSDLSDVDIDSSPTIEAINRWAARIREAFQKHQWKKLGAIVADGINAGFQYIYDVLKWERIKPIIVDGFIHPFQDFFNSMMKNIKWDLIGATLARGLDIIVYTLREWITGFEWRNFGTYIAEGMNSMVNVVDADALGRLIADKFKMAWDLFGGWVEKFNFTQLGSKLKEMILGGLDETNWSDMGKSLGGFLNGISDTINEMLGDGQVRDELADAFSEFVNSFLEEFDEEDAKEALKNIGDTIFGGIKKAFEQTDKSELVGTVTTVLSGLPWGAIAIAIGAKAGGALAKGIFGAVFKSKATGIISGLLPGASGATTTGASAAASGASATASIGLGMSAGSIVAGTGIMGALAFLGVKMREFADAHGGVQQGANLNTDRSFGTTPTAPKATNAAGYSTQIQKQTIKPSAAATTTSTKVTQFIDTVLTGKKDQSFTDLQLAKSSLLDTPVVQKIMNGEMTADFKDAYKRFTDTKAYNTVKGFGASISSTFKTWWANNINTKNYKSTKGMTASIGSTFKTWWTRNIDKKNYSSSKGMTASIGNTFSTWWWRNVDKDNYSSKKGMNASIGDTFSTWWWRNVDQGHYTATKYMKAADAGKFVSFTDKWQDIKDKWVDVNVSIVKKTSDLGAWIKGKWEELVSFEWFAHGGLFDSASFIGVGEAGAEAVLPLTSKRTMKMIGNAISNAGGMSVSGNAELANEIAMRIAPIVISAVNGQAERPVNVNAILYTEDNEVLARAVNRGNRSLDKRYHPIAQYN